MSEDPRLCAVDVLLDALNAHRSKLTAASRKTSKTTQTHVSWVSDLTTRCNDVLAVGDISPSLSGASRPRIPDEPSSKKAKVATPGSPIRDGQSVNEIDDSEDESLSLNGTVVTQPSTRPSVSSSSAPSPSTRSSAPPAPSRYGPIVFVENVSLAELQNVCDALCATVPEEHRRTAVKSAAIENGRATFKLKIHPRLLPYMEAHNGSLSVANKTYNLNVYASREEKRGLKDSF